MVRFSIATLFVVLSVAGATTHAAAQPPQRSVPADAAPGAGASNEEAVRADSEAAATSDEKDASAEEEELSCEQVCEHAEEITKDSCMTDCDVRSHGSEDAEASVKEFVGDQGGAMESAVEEQYDTDIPDCKPTIDIQQKPKFEDVDGSKDGKITLEEAEEWGKKACVPGVMMRSMFRQTDKNQDGSIDADEFARSGEDTRAEHAIDEDLDKATQGDNEYHTVDLKFETWDENADGKLNEDEVYKMALHKLKERMPTPPAETEEWLRGKVHEKFPELDTSGDGFVDKEEFDTAIHGEDMGDQAQEAATADAEHFPDPDDIESSPCGPGAVLVNYADKNPGKLTCECVPEDSECLAIGDCAYEALCVGPGVTSLPGLEQGDSPMTPHECVPCGPGAVLVNYAVTPNECYPCECVPDDHECLAQGECVYEALCVEPGVTSLPGVEQGDSAAPASVFLGHRSP